jgi:tripartite motif-containing protein 71
VKKLTPLFVLVLGAGCAAQQGGAVRTAPTDTLAAPRAGADFTLRLQRWIGVDSFLKPVALALTPTDRLLVADAGEFLVAQYTASGEEMGALGGAAAGSRFEQPIDIAVGGSLSAFVLIGDANNRRIDQYDFAGNLVGTFIQLSTPENPVAFSDPRAIAVDASGMLYVSDFERDRVSVYGPSAEPRFSFGNYGTGDGNFIDPWGLAADSFRERLYVSDSGNGRIEVFDSVGGYVSSWDLGARARPAGLAVDSKGRLWIADPGSNRVLAYDPFGNLLVSSPGGEGVDAFKGPEDVAVSRDGTVYVADTANARVGAFTVERASAGGP